MPIVAGTRISREQTLELAATLAREGSDRTARVLVDAIRLARDFVALTTDDREAILAVLNTYGTSSSICGLHSSPNSTGVEASLATTNLKADRHTCDEHRGTPDARSRLMTTRGPRRGSSASTAIGPSIASAARFDRRVSQAWPLRLPKRGRSPSRCPKPSSRTITAAPRSASGAGYSRRSGTRTRMNVMVDEDGTRTAVEREPETCEPVWWGKRLTAVAVTLSIVERRFLAELLTDAWEGKAPRRLLPDR